MTPFTILRLVAAAALLVALGSWSYGYYMLMRMLVCAVTAYGTVLAVSSGRRGWAWTFGVMAVVFNPVVPVYLDRGTWAVLDVTAATLCAASLADRALRTSSGPRTR